MIRRFRDSFIDYLDRTGLTVAEIARVSGVSVEQLKKLRQRETATTNVDDAVRIAHAFGSSLDEMLGDRTLERRGEALAAYARLTPEERDFLRTLARAKREAAQDQG